MDNNEFDKLIRSKIGKEKPLSKGSNIDNTIDNAVKKVKGKSKFMFGKFLAAAITIFIITAITINNTKQSTMKMSTSNGSEEKSFQNAISIGDVNKEKEKLKEEGYIVNKDDIKIDKDIKSDTYDSALGNVTGSITAPDEKGTSDSPVDNYMGSGIATDKAYDISLKDQVFNSDCVLKGEVLGVSYYTDNRQAYTKAKILVEESYDGNLKKGDIITVNKCGGIITQYQFILLKGIDKKFNMSNEQLEKAKNIMVVSDDYDGKLLYPDDNVILLLGKDSGENPIIKDGEYFVSGTVVEYKEDEIIKPPYIKCGNVYFTDLQDDDKEFYEYDKVSDLEEKLKNVIEEKKNFSKDKVRQIAYDLLNEEDKKGVSNVDGADVMYHRIVNVAQVNKLRKGQIDVRFSANDGKTTILVSMDEDFKIINISKQNNFNEGK